MLLPGPDGAHERAPSMAADFPVKPLPYCFCNLRSTWWPHDVLAQQNNRTRHSYDVAMQNLPLQH